VPSIQFSLSQNQKAPKLTHLKTSNITHKFLISKTVQWSHAPHSHHRRMPQRARHLVDVSTSRPRRCRKNRSPQ
jgi:hypothetical protein